MVMKQRILRLTLLLLFVWFGQAAAATVQAVADRDRVAAGESLQLQLRVAGSPDGDPDLSPLEQNWEILSRSQSSQTQIVNGSFSRSLVYSLTLMPRGQGTLTIPAVCFGRDCSLPLPIEVTDTPTAGSSSDEALLLESEVSPQKIVAQGQLLFKVRLLRRVDLLEGQLNEPQPSGVTAVVKKLGDDRSYETRRHGRLYQVIERAYAIFPQGAGKMLLPALQFDGSIAGGRTRFDPFGQQEQRVRRNSQPLTVEVTPLPKDLGRRPWIPATALTLTDDWQEQPPKLVVGEPATRTLRLTAVGVTAAQLPELKPAVPDGFKTYPDQPKRDDQQSRSGISGTLEQKIALVPTRAGHFSLPALELDWWDVAQGQWRRAHLAPLELEVTAAPGSAAAPSAPAPAPGAPVPTLTAPVVPPTVVTSAGFWPWLSLALGLAWFVTLLLFWRQWRRQRPVAAASAVDPLPTVKAARKAVVEAARRHAPQATRRALLAFSRSLWPTAGNAYEQLCRAADPRLRAELAQLDLCLYGSEGGAWDGQGLAAAIADWPAAATSAGAAQLPELYP